MVRGDGWLSVRLILDELRLNRKSIWQMITENLEMHKDGTKTVPHLGSSTS